MTIENYKDMITNNPSPIAFKQLTITEAELFGNLPEEESPPTILKETTKEVQQLLSGKTELQEDLFPPLNDKPKVTDLPTLLEDYSTFLKTEQQRIDQLKKSCTALLLELEQIGTSLENIQEDLSIRLDSVVR